MSKKYEKYFRLFGDEEIIEMEKTEIIKEVVRMNASKFPTLTCGHFELYDRVRFFHGDSPAYQLEACQQKGCDYPCLQCTVNINRSSDNVHSYYQQTLAKVIQRKNRKIKFNTNKVHMFPIYEEKNS